MAVSYPLEWYSQPRSGDTGRGRRERRRDSNRWAERCWCRGRVWVQTKWSGAGQPGWNTTFGEDIAAARARDLQRSLPRQWPRKR